MKFLPCAVALLVTACLLHSAGLDEILVGVNARYDALKKKLEEKVQATGSTLEEAAKELKKEEEKASKPFEEHQATRETIDAVVASSLTLRQPSGFIGRLHVQRSFDKPDSKLPALLSYSHTPDEENYSADVAVVFDVLSHSVRNWNLEYQLSSDIEVSTEKDGSANRMKNRLTTAAYRIKPLHAPSVGLSNIIFFGSALHEADKDFRVQNVLGEFLINPWFKWGRLTLGGTEKISVGDTILGYYQTEPFIGFEAGSQVKGNGPNPIEDGLIFRPLVRASFKFIPNVWERKLTFSVDETLRLVEDADFKGFNIFKVGMDFAVTKAVSLSLSYEVGKDAPKFQKVEVLKAGVGILF